MMWMTVLVFFLFLGSFEYIASMLKSAYRKARYGLLNENNFKDSKVKNTPKKSGGVRRKLSLS